MNLNCRSCRSSISRKRRGNHNNNRPAKIMQNGAGFSRKIWTYWPTEKEWVASVPHREQLASTPEPPLPKGKGTEPSVQSTRSLGGREPRWAGAAPWRVRGGSEREYGEERVDFTVEEGRFQGGEGGQATRVSPGEVEGNMNEWVDAKPLQDDLQSLGFTPRLAKPKIGKEVERRRARS